MRLVRIHAADSADPKLWLATHAIMERLVYGRLVCVYRTRQVSNPAECQQLELDYTFNSFADHCRNLALLHH